MCLKFHTLAINIHAQLVQHLPRTQKIAGSSPAQGSSSFSLEKKELSSGVVACICLVSITDYSCTVHLKIGGKPPKPSYCPTPLLCSILLSCYYCSIASSLLCNGDKTLTF